MKCKICGSGEIESIYHGYIRDGKVMHDTQKKVHMYQCKECQSIWHEKLGKDYSEYYESEQYRIELEGSTDISEFYRLHDRENLDKLQYTGTEIFRNKIIADIGCGGGAFLDFAGHGVARASLAIEPSGYYQKILKEKGYHVFSYIEDANETFAGMVDVATSFDVIEHVEDPLFFLKGTNQLLCDGGKLIFGTPTDAPVMRKLLGETYENRLLYSVQHLWIFSEYGLKLLAKQAGFVDIEVEYYQRYGIGNFINWLIEKQPKGQIRYDYLSETLNQVYKTELAREKLSDYMVLKATKKKG